MSKEVTVTVLREHSGDAGHHPEKSTYDTTLQHARQLRAQGLVEFEDDDAKEETPVPPSTATPAPATSGLKAQRKPRNKAEPAPANKAEGKSLNKSDKS